MQERTEMIADRLHEMLTDEIGVEAEQFTLAEWEQIEKHPTEQFGWMWPIHITRAEGTVLVRYCPERIAETVVGFDVYDVESYLLMVEYAINRHVVLLVTENMDLDKRVRTVEDELGDTWDHCFTLMNAVQAGTNGEGIECP